MSKQKELFDGDKESGVFTPNEFNTLMFEKLRQPGASSGLTSKLEEYIQDKIRESGKARKVLDAGPDGHATEYPLEVEIKYKELGFFDDCDTLDDMKSKLFGKEEKA